MRVRTLPTVLPHARTRVSGELFLANCTVMPCDNDAALLSGMRRATRRGVAGARVVWDHVVEVRLLPSGRKGTQAQVDERPVEAR